MGPPLSVDVQVEADALVHPEGRCAGTNLGYIRQTMRLESSSNLFACASLICSLSFWLALILSRFPRAPAINVSGVLWLKILGGGIVLAVVAAVLNFEKKLWILAAVLSLVTFFLVMYTNGS
jgi:hypothetical protein